MWLNRSVILMKFEWRNSSVKMNIESETLFLVKKLCTLLKSQNNGLKVLYNEERECTAGRVFALHADNPGLIPIWPPKHHQE